MMITPRIIAAGPQPTRRARIPRKARGALLGGARLSCGQRVGKVQSRQKQRLRDIPVRVQ